MSSFGFFHHRDALPKPPALAAPTQSPSGVCILTCTGPPFPADPHKYRKLYHILILNATGSRYIYRKLTSPIAAYTKQAPAVLQWPEPQVVDKRHIEQNCTKAIATFSLQGEGAEKKLSKRDAERKISPPTGGNFCEAKFPAVYRLATKGLLALDLANF